MYLIDEQLMSIILKKNDYVHVNNLLWIAAEHNYPYFAKTLMRLRTDVDVNYYHLGVTPLMLACHWSEQSFVKLLLGHPDIDTNLKANSDYAAGYKGKTAYEIAMKAMRGDKLTSYFKEYFVRNRFEVAGKMTELGDFKNELAKKRKAIHDDEDDDDDPKEVDDNKKKDKK